MVCFRVLPRLFGELLRVSAVLFVVVDQGQENAVVPK